MTVDPITVTPDTNLGRIIALMHEEGCRQLPIVDGEKLVGLVTDRDVRLTLNSPFIRKSQLDADDVLDIVVAEGMMTRNLIAVTPDTPAYKAAEMLSIYKFGALPVVDGESLVGIISVTDFLDHISSFASPALNGRKITR
jgi:acetoin utilization protein AcuB